MLIRRIFVIIAMFCASAHAVKASEDAFEIDSTYFCSSVPDSKKANCEICADHCHDTYFAEADACKGKPPLEYQQCVAVADNKETQCLNTCKNVSDGPLYLAGKCLGTNSRNGSTCICGPQSVPGKNIDTSCVVGNCVGQWKVYDSGDVLGNCN